MSESLPERLAREARLAPSGFIDCCHPRYCETPEPHPLCPVCQAIERVAATAIRAALDEAMKAVRGHDRCPDRDDGMRLLDPLSERRCLTVLATAIEALKSETPGPADPDPIIPALVLPPRVALRRLG